MRYSAAYATLATLLIIVFSLSAQAQDRPDTPLLAGQAIIHDGDTFRIKGQSIRLWGIDAPELKQRCGKRLCGLEARAALAAIISEHSVVCIPKGRSHNRIVALCRVNGADIAAAMVRRGMAFSYARYSGNFYTDAENDARARHAGIWQEGSVMPPHIWRACARKQGGHISC